MSVIRVGFVFRQASWPGGVNYYRKLFAAVQSLPDAKIQVVVFAGQNSKVEEFEGLAEIVRTPMLDRKSLSWWASKFLEKILPRRDYLLYFLLRNNRIDMISHVGLLWKGCSIPSIGWIPDFQQMRLPRFFDKKERVAQDKYFMNIIHRSNAVLLSSQDALNDLNDFCPSNSTATHILRFVSYIDLSQYQQQSRVELMHRYKLDRPWFHISNQFWAHKNHGVVIKALLALKEQGVCPLIIATGSTNDHRNVLYYPELMKMVIDYGLQNDFRALGMLPYSDVVALMRYSIAVINPSLFEGWNTSVEESKSIGKKIILSDIAVHREQNPERGCYFEPNDYDCLANLLKTTMQQYDETEDAMCQTKAQLKSKLDRVLFAKQFESICIQVVS